MTLVAFEKLALGYGGRPVVHGLDGALAAGSLTAIVGPNGAGKSTLLKGLAGLLRPLAGKLIRPGLPLGSIAYVPQSPDIDRSFPASVFDLVALGLWRRRGMFGRLTSRDRADIEAALSAVGLHELRDRRLDALSGGEFQRALFARTMLQDARLILLDEPFNSVDAQTVADLLKIIHRGAAEGRAIVAVLHNLDLVRRHFPVTLLLMRRPIAFGPTAAVLTPENLLLASGLDTGALEAPSADKWAA
jgi:zinc/manganese transport system ATP-binding protein